MKTSCRPLLFLAPLALLLAPSLPLNAEEPPALAYRFDEVKSKVLVAPAAAPKDERAVALGTTASGGDHVRTGFWGRAVLSVPDRNARFEIESSTTAVLAGIEPGILLTLRKGRLTAIFDALAGGPAVERRVAVPGALLAVRGTRYGVEASEDGRVAVAVFEGMVDVIRGAAGAAPPVRVGRGEYCTFGPSAPPRVVPMGDAGMSEKRWGLPPRGSGPDGRGPGQGPGGQGPGAPMPGQPGPGGSGAPMQPGGPGGGQPKGGHPHG